MAILIAIACAYLSLFNLGYAPLWGDETPMASVAYNLLESGKFTTWDGRNFLGLLNGRAVNKDLVAISYPPWRAISTLVGVSLFGHNETGVRFFHALLGVASLFVFWRLLQLDFASRPRLRVIAFALFALSAQSILFFRQGRYAADAIFFSLALIYMYRLYIGPTGKAWHLVCATACAVLGFFNHYFIGTTSLLAVATWHLMFFWRGTTRRQWISFMVAGVVFSTVCLGYLWLAGIIENRKNLDLGFLDYQYSWPARGFVIAYLNFRDIVRYNWIPLWIAIWLLGWACWIALVRLRFDQEHSQAANHKKWKNILPAPKPEDLALGRYFVLFALLLIFAAFINNQNTIETNFAITRYLVAALPFAFLLIAMCVDWLWHRFGALLAVALLATLMLSNLANQPASYRELRLTLPSLVQETHRPLDNWLVETASFLQANAKQDDVIQVIPAEKWLQRDLMAFYLGDKLLFCCMIDKEATPLPPDTVLSMGEHLYLGKVKPDWIVSFAKARVYHRQLPGEVEPEFFFGYNEIFDDQENYELLFISQAYTESNDHRPEMEFHFFSPSERALDRTHIYKKKSSEKSQP